MTPANYYQSRLSSDRLRRCYDLAPPRVRQYMDAEIAHVSERIEDAASVLELGCGYGRVLEQLARPGRWTVGIDTSVDSLVLGREELRGRSGCDLAAMDAAALGWRDGAFEAVVCIQNGACAFRVDQTRLFREALRVTRPGGRVVFSTYAEAFWPHRLEWFEIQAAAGLVGEIDRAATRPGLIVCQDGFRSGTLNADAFTRLCAPFGVQPTLVEVDGSSLFCEIVTQGGCSP